MARSKKSLNFHMYIAFLLWVAGWWTWEGILKFKGPSIRIGERGAQTGDLRYKGSEGYPGGAPQTRY